MSEATVADEMVKKFELLCAFYHRGRRKYTEWTTEELARRTSADEARVTARARWLKAEGYLDGKSIVIGRTHVSAWAVTPKGEKAARTLREAAEVVRSA